MSEILALTTRAGGLSAPHGLRPPPESILAKMKGAVRKAISFVTAAIEAGQRLDIGKGPGPLWHMHDFYPTKLPEAD